MRRIAVLACLSLLVAAPVAEGKARTRPPGSKPLSGSVGAWFAGRWHTQPAEDYIRAVKGHLKARTWRTRDFAGG